MSIKKDTMVVNLQIGVWMGYRLDKDASRHVTTNAHADDDAARVNKHLIPKSALKPVISAASSVRTHFYDRTLPWKDNGDRLLTRRMYMPFVEQHARLVAEFEGQVEDFLARTYLSARDQAEFRMGALFKEDDYPEPSELRRRFYVHLDIDAVTEANDFRVALDDSERDAIKEQMEGAMQQRLGRAMLDVWQRLARTLGHFAEKVGAEDALFRDSTVRNLEEIIDILPALNILDDPNLERIRKDIQNSLVCYEPVELRKKPKVREAAAGEAKRIMDEMAGFMTAFAGVNQ